MTWINLQRAVGAGDVASSPCTTTPEPGRVRDVVLEDVRIEVVVRRGRSGAVGDAVAARMLNRLRPRHGDLLARGELRRRVGLRVRAARSGLDDRRSLGCARAAWGRSAPRARTPTLRTTTEPAITTRLTERMRGWYAHERRGRQFGIDAPRVTRVEQRCSNDGKRPEPRLIVASRARAMNILACDSGGEPVRSTSE